MTKWDMPSGSRQFRVDERWYIVERDFGTHRVTVLDGNTGRARTVAVERYLADTKPQHVRGGRLWLYARDPSSELPVLQLDAVTLEPLVNPTGIPVRSLGAH